MILLLRFILIELFKLSSLFLVHEMIKSVNHVLNAPIYLFIERLTSLILATC